MRVQKLRRASKRRCAGFTLTEAAITVGVMGIVLGGMWWGTYRVYENYKIGQAVNDWDLLASVLEDLSMKQQLNLPTTDTSSSLSIGNTGWYYAGVVNGMLAQGGYAPPAIIDNTVSPPILINPWGFQTTTSTNGVSSSTADGIIVTVGTLTSGGLTIPANDANAMTQYANENCGGVANQACIPTAAGADAFEIAYNNIPADACIQLAMLFAGPSRPNGVVTIFIGLSNWVPGGGVGLGGTSPLPITLSQATTLCNEAGNPFSGSSGYASTFIDIVYQL